MIGASAFTANPMLSESSKEVILVSALSASLPVVPPVFHDVTPLR